MRKKRWIRQTEDIAAILGRVIDDNNYQLQVARMTLDFDRICGHWRDPNNRSRSVTIYKLDEGYRLVVFKGRKITHRQVIIPLCGALFIECEMKSDMEQVMHYTHKDGLAVGSHGYFVRDDAEPTAVQLTEKE